MHLLSLPAELFEYSICYTLHALLGDDPIVGKQEAAQVQVLMNEDVARGTFHSLGMEWYIADLIAVNDLSERGQCLVSSMHRRDTIRRIVESWLPPALVCKEFWLLRRRLTPLLADAAFGVFPAHMDDSRFVACAYGISFGKLPPIHRMPDEVRSVRTREQMHAEVAYRQSTRLATFWKTHDALNKYCRGVVSRARRAGNPYQSHVHRPRFKAKLAAFAHAHDGVKRGDQHFAHQRLDEWVKDELQTLLGGEARGT